MKEIIGKRILTIRGFNTDRKLFKTKKQYFEERYILFDDKKTILELDEQDYYSYHDCSTSARILRVKQDKKEWERIFKDKVNYPVANTEID